MGRNKEDSKPGRRERIKLFLGRSSKEDQADTSSRTSENKLPCADTANTQSVFPAQVASNDSTPSGNIKQSPQRTCLWERAAERLDQEDREELDLIQSKSKTLLGCGADSLARDVELILERAGGLKEEGKQLPVVDKIIQGARVFKALGDAAAQFDKSGYASLGWSVVSFGVQVAANAGDARDFVLSSSEIITRFMAKYRELELFRSPEAGKDFDEQLTNVYKSILLYTIALDKYLRQSGLARLAYATLKLEDRSLNLRKKAIIGADAEISHWLFIISQKHSDKHFSQIRTLIQDRPLTEVSKPSQLCMKSLAFPGMNLRFNDIERASEGTCKWLLGHETYRDWAADTCGMLCIKGKPGSGKSTLLQYAVLNTIVGSNIRDRSFALHNAGLARSGDPAGTQFEPGAVILSFFFHDRGTELQKTALGLFQSLLHQIFHYIPDAMPDDLLATFQDRLITVGEPGKQWHWHWRELRDFFGSSLQRALRKRPIYILIDALDEYGKENSKQLIQSFEKWIRDRPSQSQLHICFTCRYHPHLELPERASEIRLDSENEHDISAYVSLQLSPWSSSEHVAAIQTSITGRASGVFIWARFIIERVLKLKHEGESWGMIREEVERSPLELNEIYRGLIEQAADKPNSLKLVQWICFAMRPLTLEELRWAMVVESDLSYSPNTIKDYESSKHFASDCEMMEKKLTALSCGLVEATPSKGRTVQFIHQSVKDFFISEGLCALQSEQSLATAKTLGHNLQAMAHYKLSRTCVRYLSADEILDSKKDSYALVTKLVAEYPLLEYATVFLAAHVRESDEASTQNDLLSYFGWPSESITECWLQVRKRMWSLPYADKMFIAVHGTTLLHVAAAYRWMGPLLEIIERTKEPPETGIISYVRQANRWTGSLLGVLGERKAPANHFLNAMNAGGYTPVALAAWEGHEDIVKLLLTNGADVNGGGEDASIPLWIAAFRGNLNTARTLLENGANSNALENSSSSALAVASTEGHGEMVSVLLEHGADANGVFGELRSPLIGAAMYGHDHIVKDLLENGADVNARFTGKESALAVASSRGHEETVSMLLGKGADVNGDFGVLGSPLIRAARFGHERIIEVLLEHGADVHAQSEMYGCALAAAIGPYAKHERIIRILLEKGADRNAHGGRLHENRSVLQLAEGLDEILQMLRQPEAA